VTCPLSGTKIFVPTILCAWRSHAQSDQPVALTLAGLQPAQTRGRIAICPYRCLVYVHGGAMHRATSRSPLQGQVWNLPLYPFADEGECHLPIQMFGLCAWRCHAQGDQPVAPTGDCNRRFGCAPFILFNKINHYKILSNRRLFFRISKVLIAVQWFQHWK
jgi:hypothetical protein